MKKIDKNLTENLFSAAASLDPTGISGFILNSGKAILSIQDKIYLKKYQEFWRVSEENKISIEDFIRKTKEQNDWQKVGQNFLLAIDGFSCFDKCYYYGKIWVGWLEKKIDTNELQEMTHLLQNILLNDLHYFLRNKSSFEFWRGYETCDSEIEFERLCFCAFLTKTEDKEYEKDHGEIIERQKITYYITTVGKKFLELIQNQ